VEERREGTWKRLEAAGDQRSKSNSNNFLAPIDEVPGMHGVPASFDEVPGNR